MSHTTATTEHTMAPSTDSNTAPKPGAGMTISRRDRRRLARTWGVRSARRSGRLGRRRVERLDDADQRGGGAASTLRRGESPAQPSLALRSERAADLAAAPGPLKRRHLRQARRQKALTAYGRARAAGSVTRMLAATKPTGRGWSRPGAGSMRYLDPCPEWQGTSVHVCGLWPFSVTSASPREGVPLGPRIGPGLINGAGATVCSDPIYWFLRGLITNPSAFVMAKPGLGKSTLVRRMLTVLQAWGIVPMILSDLRPDYVDLVRAMDGQVIQLDRSEGSINPLDPGPLWDRLHELPEQLRRRAQEDLRSRRQECMIGLLTVVLGRELHAREATMIAAGLRALDDEFDGVPLPADLHALIRDGHPAVRAMAVDNGDPARYRQIVEDLETGFNALGPDGRFGSIFSRQTSTPMRLDKPVAFDMSGIDTADHAMRGAVQLVCWVYGSSSVSSAKYLAEAGLAEDQVYMLVMDELWQVLRASEYLVDRIDELTRLNRGRLIGQILITHTMKDLRLSTPALTGKAMGFVERSAVLYLGGLAGAEFGDLGQIHEFSTTERQLLDSWTIGAEGTANGQDHIPPGRGKFLIKTGSGPGVPVQVLLTATELDVNNTNRRWETAAAKARGMAADLSRPAQSADGWDAE